MAELTARDINELDPNKKGKDFCLIRAKRMHRSYMNGATQSFFRQKANWKLNSYYSMGKQPIDIYKKWLDRDSTEQFDHLNFAVAKVMPKIFDILIGMISRIAIDIQCDAIDPKSCDRKLMEQYRKEAEIVFQQEIADFEKVAGIKVRDTSAGYSNLEELEMDVEAGNLKLDFEIAVEELISTVFNHNNIDELRMDLTRDFANCGMGIIRHYVLKNGLIKTRRVNPIFFVSNYVTSRNFREFSEGGEEIYITIHDLREVAGNEFSEQDYYDIALKVANKYNNPGMANYDTIASCYMEGTGGYIYDKFTIRIFDCEFVTTDRYIHLAEKPNRYGNKETRSRKVGYQPSAENAGYTKNTDYKVWYGTKWIVGTEYSYGCGKIQFPNVKANALNESKSTFAVCALHIEDMVTQTITERCIEFMDDIVLSWVQMQSYTAKAVPPGISIDTTAISNIPKGKGKTWDPLDLIKYYTKTGNMLTNMRLPDGTFYAKLPIQENKGSDLSQINFWLNKIFWNIDMIKNNFGLNDSTDASNPNPEASVTGQRLAVQGTNNSLQPLITALDEVIIKTAEGIVNRAQHMASLGQLDYLANAIGRNNLKVLGFSPEVSAAVFAMKMTPRMDDIEKMQLEENIKISLQQRSQTGVGGIEVEDSIAIRRCKNLKQAEKMLVFRRKKRAREDEEKSQRQVDYNTKQQTISGQQVEKAKQATMALEFELYKKKKMEVDLPYEQAIITLKGRQKENEIQKTGQVKHEVNAHDKVVEAALTPAEESTEK